MGIKCPKCHSDNPDTQQYCGECGTQLIPSSEEISVSHTKTLETPKEEFTRGTTFADRYEFIEELGTGGMGSVYKVFDKKIKEEVALKILKPVIADEKTIERFSSELKLARKIRHENVCQMYDINEEEGTHYITMEYVPGEDLKSFIRRVGQLPVGKTISIAKQVCDGLSESHRLGVVHRDLKPQNIMIDKEGNARIMDFGIARSIKGKGITGAGMMIGTPEYMSPEQVEGKEVDHRSDIYSLGVNLYEMVTGQVPFEGDTPFTIGVKHKSETPKDPKGLNAQIPEDLGKLILKCMEKSNENRYQSASEVRSELENIEKGIPTTERVVPKRKPITSKEITVKFSLKKLLFPASIVLALIIITSLVIILRFPPKREVIPLAPTDKPSLAIMYFENNTGDESLGHYRKAISDLLITDLAQSKYLRILSGATLYNILKEMNLLVEKSYSSKDLREVAARGGVEHILLGSYTKAGENFRISIMLHRARTEELIGSEIVEGIGEKSIFSMIDELTRRIKANFQLSVGEISGDIDEEVGKITTNSPEALKYYKEARKHHLNLEYSKAQEFYKKAIAIDPGFAMSYRGMATTYSRLTSPDERKEYMQKAFELSDRLSDRERYQIMGGFYVESEETYDKAIEAYIKLLRLYPDDWTGNYNLALIYNNLEEWDKVIERLEVNRQTKWTFIPTYNTLANAYAAKGLYDKAAEVLNDYLHNIEDIATLRSSLGLTYLIQQKYDLALAEVDKALLQDPNNRFLIILKNTINFYHKGNLIQAEKEYQNMMDSKNPWDIIRALWEMGYLYRLQGRFEEEKDSLKQNLKLAKKMGIEMFEYTNHKRSAYLHLISGDFEGAIKECDAIWRIAVEQKSLSRQSFALHWKGMIYAEMKSFAEAKKAAEELKEMIEREMNKKLMRRHRHLQGMIELKRENFSRAIEYFKEAIALLSYPCSLDTSYPLYINSLARAYFKKGEIEKARKEYERNISPVSHGYGDIYAKSFYMLGKIYEQKGWKGKAIEHYEKFLSLWKDADPGIAEVEDAKKRVAGLKE